MKEKKKLNKKKLIIVLVLLILVIGTIAFFTVRHFRGDVAVAPDRRITETPENEGKLKCENNIEKIKVGEIETTTLDKNKYIMIEISNETEEDIFNLPIGIEFINADGDVIYNTGYVVDVLLKGMIDNVHAVITPQIAKLIEKNKIDHIVIKELQ